MPIGPQPKGARGTAGHPYSALNLRLALAIFGLVFLAALAAALFGLGHTVLGAVAVALAAVTVADIVVIQLRRRQRKRLDRQRHGLFE
jgi:membrane protein implicated in regulation of membrane protease activity